VRARGAPKKELIGHLRSKRRIRRSRPLQPNELWCADYKGEFMLADRRYCYPLTVTDAASRYLITTMRTHSRNGFRNQPQVIMTCFIARTRVNKHQITHYGKSEFS
jgi:transposase InsO family protein